MFRFTSILIVLAACAGDVDDSDSADPNPMSPNPSGPSDDPNKPTGGALTAGEFLTALGHKDCDDAFACKASFPTDAGVTFAEAFGADTNACYASAAEYYNAAAVEAAITAGKITYDGTAAKACVDGFAAPTCGTYWTQGPDFPAACDTAMVGKVAVGGACTVDFECAGENWCDEATKKCAAIPQGARKGERESVTVTRSLFATRAP